MKKKDNVKAKAYENTMRARGRLIRFDTADKYIESLASYVRYVGYAIASDRTGISISTLHRIVKYNYIPTMSVIRRTVERMQND